MRIARIILTALLCASTFGASNAQNIIEVHRLSNWGRDFLTVTNNWFGIYATPTEGQLPPCMAVITEVNGQSTKEMTETRFNEIIGQNDRVEITYLQKENGKNVEKRSVLTPRKDYHIVGGVAECLPKVKPSTINFTADTDIDFFDYNTYDYIVAGDDKLTDKDICRQLGKAFEARGMRYSTDSADIIFTMQKAFDQSSSSHYVPKTSQVVNTGSTTSYWNDKKGKLHASTYQNNQTVTQGGYSYTESNTTLNVLVNVMDGKKYRENPESMPVVYRFDFNQHYGSLVDMKGAIRSDVTEWLSIYPFTQPVFSDKVETTGIVFNSYEDIRSGLIKDVLPGTEAWNKGLRAGHQIEKAYMGRCYFFWWWRARRKFFEAGSDKTSFACPVMIGYIILLPIPFPGNKIKNQPYDYLTIEKKKSLIENQWYEGHDKSGGKFKIKGPFKASSYHYNYISKYSLK